MVEGPAFRSGKKCLRLCVPLAVVVVDAKPVIRLPEH
jgi:hypothetical protein